METKQATITTEKNAQKDQILKKTYKSKSEAEVKAMKIRNTERGIHAQAVLNKGKWSVRVVGEYVEPRKPRNMWLTSDIRISKDSVGYYYAEHKFQGVLYECCIFEDRSEARRAAVIDLRNKKEN